MNDLKFSLYEMYEHLKIKPKDLFKNPLSIFLTPLFLYIYIKKRWNTKPETIYLIETNINNHPLLNKKPDKSFEIVWYNNFDNAAAIILKRINEESGFKYYMQEVKARIDRGDYLVALLIYSKPVAYVFVSKKRAYYPQVKHYDNLNKDCFAIYDVYTFKDFRGNRYYETLLSAIIREMKKLNYSRFWLWVMKHNQVSVKVHDNLLINHVIRVYTEKYRYGIRHFSKQEVNFYLRDLIDI